MEDQPAVTLGNHISRVHESGNPILGSEIKKILRMARFYISYNFSLRKKYKCHKPSVNTFNGMHKIWRVWLCLWPVAHFILIEYAFSLYLQDGKANK